MGKRTLLALSLCLYGGVLQLAPAAAVELNFDHLTQRNTLTVAENSLWGVALLSLYADWATTRDMGKYYDTPNPKTGKSYREKGMFGLFGDRPSEGEVNAYFATLVAVNLTINMVDSLQWGRSFLNSLQTSVHFNAAKNNMEIGLSAGF